MSRLDSFIRRLCAQRACLDAAAAAIAAVPGPVLEVGLGNGRTFDHLRSLLPDRSIFVFDQRMAAHPDCVPDADRLVLGDIRDTLPVAAATVGAPVALLHSDIGSGDSAANERIAAFLSGVLPLLMAEGGVILSDQRLDMAGWSLLPLPADVRPGRYFFYGRTPTETVR